MYEMNILFLEDVKEFHLYNDKISYIMSILRNGQLGQLYYGKRIKERNSFAHLLKTARRDMAPCIFEGDSSFSLEHIKQEYPAYGSGDMRYAACEVEMEDGSRVVDFKYHSHRIYQGKSRLEGLPCVYTENQTEACTLEITLVDEIINTDLILSYTIFEDAVIARNARFVCNNKRGITLHTAMSVSLDLPDSSYEMIDLTGAWGRERWQAIHKLHQGIQSIYSMRGHSSHQYNPFLALKRWNTDEKTGEAIGFSLVYSGNFLAQVEVDPFDVTRVMMGIHPAGFTWNLKNGESFQTPEVIMVYSHNGLNEMSQIFHKLYRTRLARGYWRDKERPIVINNWEATYMKFTEHKILDIAAKARELGIELFVLDDGWFGKRNDDTTSLGDWIANPDKLPNGIEGLAEKMEALGMKFGLWFEPEMISKESKLYKEHPDWMLAVPYRIPCHGRNQYVLDFTREEVVDHIAKCMEKILDSSKIHFIKWDMNRSLTDVYSIVKEAGSQGRVFHEYMLGVYKLYDRLTSHYPEVLFESCASGGGRFDPGMLYYAPQAWTSDDTDAVERLKIQYGTSMVYPLSCISNHVSAVPNHQVFRNTPIKSRADVAYFGVFGYELNVLNLTQEEQIKIKEQVEFVKQYRSFIAKGTFYRLLNPFEGNKAAWMVVDDTRKKAIAGYYRMMQPVNAGYERLKLQGLLADQLYKISNNDIQYYGDELMEIGFDISDTACGPWTPDIAQGDYQSRLFMIEAI